MRRDQGTRCAQEKPRRLSAGVIAGIAVGGVVLCGIIICLLAAVRTTAFPHVTVLDIEMGGMRADEIESCWREESAGVCSATNVLLEREGEHESLCEVSYAELGLSVTPEEASRSAMAVGRQGNFITNGISFVRSWFSVTEAMPAMTVDDRTLDAKIEDLVANCANTVVRGDVQLLPDGAQGPGMYITKPKNGECIDGATLRQTLDSEVAARSVHTVICAFRQEIPEDIQAETIYQELHGAVAEAWYDKLHDVVTESRVGVDFDIAALQAQIDSAPEGTTFLADAEVTFPKVSTELLSKGLFRDVLGTVTTKVSGTASRIHNVYLAARKIDGRIYNPGETFWYNATVGERTEEAGFGPAPSYVGGKTVDSIGGGICQVSSTLYYAALLSDMQIVMRYAHQFVPGYILWGCDATVSWGGCDFAFRNNSDFPIKIVTTWSDANELTVSIMGTKTDKSHVEMTNQVISSTDWETQYVINEEMLPGSEPVEVQTPYTGYLVKTYRNRYDDQGKLVSTTLEATSDYEKRDRVYEVDRLTYETMFGQQSPQTQ